MFVLMIYSDNTKYVYRLSRYDSWLWWRRCITSAYQRRKQYGIVMASGHWWKRQYSVVMAHYRQWWIRQFLFADLRFLWPFISALLLYQILFLPAPPKILTHLLKMLPTTQIFISCIKIIFLRRLKQKIATKKCIGIKTNKPPGSLEHRIISLELTVASISTRSV